MKPAIYLLTLTFWGLIGCSSDQQAIDDTEPALVIAAENGDMNQLDILLASSNKPDIRDSCRWTPLMKAALNGHLQIVEKLLQHGANPNLADKGGYTPLHLAASNNHAAIVEHLIKQGALVDAREHTNGWTPLLWAAKRGHSDSVSKLLELGANPTVTDFQGKTPYARAEQLGHTQVATMLQ